MSICAFLVVHVRTYFAYLRCYNTEDRNALFFGTNHRLLRITRVQLEGLLKENGRVRVIVVDSVAFHFRRDFADMILRTRLLNGMAQTLLRLASEHELAVRACPRDVC